MIPLFQTLLSADKEFDPYLKKIDEIDSNVNELEHTVQLLDDYTKRLGREIQTQQ